jgi:hypothetical protein
MARAESDAPQPPTPLAKRFVRYLMGFGVGVTAGVAPFLGLLEVPGFEALLQLFPESLRPSLIPLSAFLMGLVAVGVQFLHHETASRASLRRWFLVAFAAVAAGFVWLAVVYDTLVIRIDIPAADTVFTEVIAPRRLPPPACPCATGVSDEECIREYLHPSRIENCWGNRALRRSKAMLRGAYLLLTGGFGALIGLLLLREPDASRKRSGTEPPRRRARPPRPPRPATGRRRPPGKRPWRRGTPSS